LDAGAGALEVDVGGGEAVALRRSRRATMRRRNTFRLAISSALTRRSALPNAAKASRAPSTMARSSAGSADMAWSQPGRFLSVVKCFSIMHAPNATAAIGTAEPSVWSL